MAELSEVRIVLNRKAIKEITGTRDMQVAMTMLAGYTEASAKRHAPVATGNLRRSITHDVERTPRGWVAYVGTNVKYGIFQEVGTIHHPPHPFLRPALSDLQAALATGSFG